MSELFYAAVMLFGASRTGGTLKEWPGLWSRAVGDYTVYLNAHDETLQTEDGISVPFGRVVITFNGWPFAVLCHDGGEIGAGELANEDACIEALTAEIERLDTEANDGQRHGLLSQQDAGARR